MSKNIHQFVLETVRITGLQPAIDFATQLDVSADISNYATLLPHVGYVCINAR
jgi:hypothetical protein